MINFSKKNDSKYNKFEIRIEINKWELVQELNEFQLKKIRDDINVLLGLSEIAEKFNITILDSEKIKYFHDKNSRCSRCAFKMKNCDNCVLICQSPLERDLYLALLSLGLEVKLQQRINKDGKIMDHTTEVNKSQILTIPDFFIVSNEKKYCIYTDGHTYHERTEYQALRDRNIDRELQLLNFVVLRYTGKEIRTNLKSTALHIFNNCTGKILGIEEETNLDDFIKSMK